MTILIATIGDVPQAEGVQQTIFSWDAPPPFAVLVHAMSFDQWQAEAQRRGVHPYTVVFIPRNPRVVSRELHHWWTFDDTVAEAYGWPEKLISLVGCDQTFAVRGDCLALSDAEYRTLWNRHIASEAVNTALPKRASHLSGCDYCWLASEILLTAICDDRFPKPGEPQSRFTEPRPHFEFCPHNSILQSWVQGGYQNHKMQAHVSRCGYLSCRGSVEFYYRRQLVDGSPLGF